MTDPVLAISLLTTLAHDIRTPLNTMLISLTLLEFKHRDRFDDEDRADIGTLRAGMRSILDLHEDILHHATLVAGGATLAKAEFRPDEALRTCAEAIRPLAAQKA